MCDCCTKIIVQNEVSNGSAFYYTKINFQPDIAEPTGYPLLAGAAVTIVANSTSKVTALDMTSMVVGDYLLMFEGIIEGGQPLSANFNYEIRLNGTVIPYSTRVFRILGGTPSQETYLIGVKVPVTITSTSDVLTVWVYNHHATEVIVIEGASLTALRK